MTNDSGILQVVLRSGCEETFQVQYTGYKETSKILRERQRYLARCGQGEWRWKIQSAAAQQLAIVTFSSSETHLPSTYRLLQVLGAVVATDKTQLTNFGSDKSAWTEYLTIGNISKDLPCQYATVLI